VDWNEVGGQYVDILTLLKTSFLFHHALSGTPSRQNTFPEHMEHAERGAGWTAWPPAWPSYCSFSFSKFLQKREKSIKLG
jgi:hypothetical protein